MDRELLDLIADYIEARAIKRDYPNDFDPKLSQDPDALAAEILARWSGQMKSTAPTIAS